MTQRPLHLTTLVVEKETLKILRHMARKDESYDQLINSLINLKLQQQNVNDNENSEAVRLSGPHRSKSVQG